ncbi:MAG: 50S ribosomal protein L9 [Phycisphaerae bacterium]
MKLLLTKDVDSLGYVGEVVTVSAGYARNYLLPHHLATEPTEANMRRLADERKKAEERRRTLREARLALAETLSGVEVTIAAAANEDGVLYGSVGPREISAALRDEDYPVEPSHVQLHDPIKHLDNVQVDVKLADDITTQVKVWVVRSKATEVDADEAGEGSDATHATGSGAGTEAGNHGDGTDT